MHTRAPHAPLRRPSVRALAAPLLAGLVLSAPAAAQDPNAVQAAPEPDGPSLELSALVSDGMVLQRDANAPVWGTGRPGAAVTVTASWSDRPTRAIVENDGSWRLNLATPPAGGPHTLRFEMDDDVVIVEDVLSGEVWLASGQSNMEWKIDWISAAIPDYEAARATVADPELRFFDVPNRIATEPQTSLEGEWVAITPETWPNVSAVAYYFAHELRAALDVPVGVLSSEWGGTVAESWTGELTLRAGFPEFDATLDRIAAARDGGEEDPLEARQAAWWQALAGKDAGSRDGWQAPGFDATDWKSMELPATWEERGLDFDGVVWFRRTVEVPAAWAGRELVLELGAIDDMDTTWWDGERVGGIEQHGQWTTARAYTIPADHATAGEHVVAVRVVDTGGGGGITAQNGALRLRPAGAEDAAPRSLAGAWSYRAGASMGELGEWPSRSWFHQNQPTALFNGMIAPLVGYGLRGAIWYQGESNRTRAAQYERLFPALITDWRTRWGRGDFPFLFVQLAPYRYGGTDGPAGDLRDAQRRTLALPNTGMAVTLDIGDTGDIHPRNKWEVGRRLALWARGLAYGEADLDVSGPLYREHEVEGDAVRVRFDHAEEGLTAKGGAPSHFELAGADGVWHPATATLEGSTVVVRSDAVSAPVHVRYAGGDADEPNLFDAHGLPASSFRTDDLR